LSANVASTAIDATTIPSPTSSAGLAAPPDDANYSAANSPIDSISEALGLCSMAKPFSQILHHLK